MQIIRACSLVILLLVMAGPNVAQSYRIGFINIGSFFDREKGIVRLVNAAADCRRESSGNNERCLAETVQPIIHDITTNLSSFAARNRLILIDADSGKYCIIEGDVPDFTKQFIDEYNRAHP